MHYFEALDCVVKVIRNDEITDEIIARYHKIVISPGSGLPKDAGKINYYIKKHAPLKSILGICLGQQAIAEIFGGELKALPETKHGVFCEITHLQNDEIYQKIPIKLNVGSYFSWETTKLPDSLIPTAISKDGIIMSLKHNKYDLKAVQYHPESILTDFGKAILNNWVSLTT